MKNHDENIDQLFKEKLENRSFEIPAAFLSDLESKLPAQKKKKIWLWWFSSFIVLSFLFYLSYITLNSPTSTLVINTDKIESHSFESSLKITDTLVAISNKENNFNQVNDLVIAEFDTENKSTLNQNEFQDKDQQKINYDNFSILDREVGNENSNTTNKDNNYSNQTSSNFQKDTSLSKDKINTKVKDKESRKTSNNTINSTINKNDTVIQKIDTTTIQKDIQKNKALPRLYSDSIRIKDSIVIRDSVIIRDSIVIRDSVVIRDSITLPSKKANKFEFRMFGGLSSVSSILKSENTNFSELFEQRKESIMSPEIGLSVQYKLNQLSLGIGVSHYNYGENISFSSTISTNKDSIFIDYFDITTTFDSISGTFDTIYTPVFDTTQVTTTIFEANNISNRYSKISIPLSIGYRFDFNKWTLAPQFNILFEFELNNSFRSYPNSSFNAVSTIKPKNFQMSYMAQLEIRRNFNNWYLYLSPFYRSNFSNTILNDNFSIKYNAIGVIIGMGVQF